MITERTTLSLTLLLVGVGLFLHTYTLGFADLGGAFSPVFFPRIILAGWITLALMSLVADVMSARKASTTQWWVVVSFMLALAGYIALLQALGFFASSVLFSIVALLTSGQRNFRDIALFSILVPGSLVVLFNHVLTMPLPVSPIFWWV